MVWWQCHRNPSHEWQAVIDNRFSHSSGCPHCRPIIGSSVEDLFACILDERGIPYERQKVIGRCHVDFYLPTSNTVIEIQGCYWHGCVQCECDEEVYRVKHRQDAKRKDYLRKRGYQVEEIWEHELQADTDTLNIERLQ